MKKSPKVANAAMPIGKLFAATLMLIFLMLAMQHAVAQDKWSVGLRGAYNIPTQDLADASLDNGFGFEGTIAYRFLPNLSINTGWGWNKFAADQSFAGADMEFEETGYMLGLQLIQPIAQSRISYLLGAGGIYNHIEVENNDGDIIADSSHGLGWQADAGFSFLLGERLSLQPTVRYRALSREIEIENTTTELDLNYVSVGLGINLAF